MHNRSSIDEVHNFVALYLNFCFVLLFIMFYLCTFIKGWRHVKLLWSKNKTLEFYLSRWSFMSCTVLIDIIEIQRPSLQDELGNETTGKIDFHSSGIEFLFWTAEEFREWALNQTSDQITVRKFVNHGKFWGHLYFNTSSLF